MNEFPSIDELMSIAKNTPEKLDDIFQHEYKKILNNGCSEESRKRLEGTQFKINLIKANNKDNHLKTCIEMSRLMHESFGELNGKLQEFSYKRNSKNVDKKVTLRVIK